MRVSLVLTLVGTDRPGLVESVAQAVAAQGGNWLESRLARLGGQFAGIVRIDAPAEAETALRAALRGLERRGLAVVIAADEATAVAAVRAGRRASLELVGQDRPGIVREVTRVLAGHGVNVEELETVRRDAPQSGGQLFEAVATVELPAGTDEAALRADLERIAADLMVELRLQTGAG